MQLRRKGWVAVEGRQPRSERTDRRGSVLVVVIALLGMLLLVGISFLTFASSEQRSAEYFADAAKAQAGADSEKQQTDKQTAEQGPVTAAAVAKPEEPAKPAEPKPAEPKPEEKPAETKPAEPKPEEKPAAEKKPEEPAAAKPNDPKPSETNEKK